MHGETVKNLVEVCLLNEYLELHVAAHSCSAVM